MLLMLETHKTFLLNVCCQNTSLMCISTILTSNKLFMIFRYNVRSKINFNLANKISMKMSKFVNFKKSKKFKYAQADLV